MKTEINVRQLSNVVMFSMAVALLLITSSAIGGMPIPIPKVAEPENPPGNPRGATPIEIPKVAEPQGPSGTPVGATPIEIPKVAEPQTTPGEKAEQKGIILQREEVRSGVQQER